MKYLGTKIKGKAHTKKLHKIRKENFPMCCNNRGGIWNALSIVWFGKDSRIKSAIRSPNIARNIRRAMLLNFLRSRSSLDLEPEVTVWLRMKFFRFSTGSLKWLIMSTFKHDMTIVVIFSKELILRVTSLHPSCVSLHTCRINIIDMKANKPLLRYRTMRVAVLFWFKPLRTPAWKNGNSLNYNSSIEHYDLTYNAINKFTSKKQHSVHQQKTICWVIMRPKVRHS